MKVYIDKLVHERLIYFYEMALLNHPPPLTFVTVQYIIKIANKIPAVLGRIN